MSAFTVVYIQLTALQVGAKYLKMALIVMNEFYEQQIEKLKSQLDNEICKNKANLFNREIANYEKALKNLRLA